MPYDYTANEQKKENKKPIKKTFGRRIKGVFLLPFHWIANLFHGFGAYRLAGRMYRWLTSFDDDAAMFKLGKLYWWGYKFKRDPTKAIELIENALNRGNTEAQLFKDEMTKDDLWQQGKNQDEFMSMFDQHIYKESKRVHSMHILSVAIYTTLIAVIVFAMRIVDHFDHFLLLAY